MCGSAEGVGVFKSVNMVLDIDTWNQIVMEGGRPCVAVQREWVCLSQ